MSRTPQGAAVLQQSKTATITDAVLDELSEVGYGRLAMEAVARRAGVGKSALYRRWPSRRAMVAAALGELSVPTEPPRDTGTLDGDVRALLEELTAWLTDPRIARILPDLTAEGVRDPELAAALTEAVGTPRRAGAAAVFARAAARGELAVDVDLALDLVAAPIYWRLTVRFAELGPGYLDALAAALVRALRR